MIRPFQNKFNYLFTTKIDTIPLLNINKPELINLNSNLLYIEPSEKYVIENATNKKSFQGKNEKGQAFINSLTASNLYNIAEKALEKNSLIAGDKMIDSIFDFDYKRLEKLYQQKLVNTNFYNRITQFLNHRKIFTQSRMALRTYMNTQIENALISKEFNKEAATYWANIYKNNPVTNTSLQTNNYWFEYTDYYVLYYNLWFKQNKQLNYNEHYKTYFTDYLSAAKTILKGDTLEYFIACFLSDSFSYYDYEKNLITAYTNFEKEYPNSKYISFLKKNYPVAREYKKVLAQPKSKDVHFIENSNEITSYNQLIAPFKGQKIYIYFWKSIFPDHDTDFRALIQLQPCFKENNIATIFVAIDDDKSEENWKDVVNYYQLKGSHIRANTKLIQDLSKHKSNQYYPDAIIINEKGEEKFASLPRRPSFIKQLQ